MHTVNLLPWRKQQAQRLKHKQIFVILLVAILACLMNQPIILLLNHRKNSQEKRNERLLQMVQRYEQPYQKYLKLDKECQQLKRWQQQCQKDKFHNIKFYQQLQKLSELIPNNIYLNKLDDCNKQLILTGIAQNSVIITHLLSQLSGELMLKDLELNSMHKNSQGEEEFNVTLALV